MINTTGSRAGPRHPPHTLFTYLINPIMREVLRTPSAARRLGRMLMLLAYTGRRSRRRVVTPVGYQREGPRKARRLGLALQDPTCRFTATTSAFLSAARFT